MAIPFTCSSRMAVCVVLVSAFPGGRALLANLEKVTDKAEVIRLVKASFAYARMNGIVPPWSKQGG